MDLGETGKVLEFRMGATTHFRSPRPVDESCYLGNPFVGFGRKPVYALTFNMARHFSTDFFWSLPSLMTGTNDTDII